LTGISITAEDDATTAALEEEEEDMKCKGAKVWMLAIIVVVHEMMSTVCPVLF